MIAGYTLPDLNVVLFSSPPLPHHFSNGQSHINKSYYIITLFEGYIFTV